MSGSDARDPEVIASIAHDQRGGVSVALGAVDQLAMALGDDDAKAVRLVGMARRGLRRVLRATERLSRDGELSAQTARLAPTDVDVRSAVAEAVEAAKELDARADVEIQVRGTDSRAVVFVNPDWFMFAMQEIVGHAIRTAIKTVSVAVTATGQGVRIEISNDAQPESLRDHASGMFGFHLGTRALQAMNLMVHSRNLPVVLLVPDAREATADCR
ncbi:MAG: hypothetical protein R3A78_12055 [Polyangiales bacterium]|nr:hypothetical protein [Myxococcales bacterium]